MADNHFFIRKLHSLLGVIPVGLFLLEHLFTNSFALKGATAFNEKVEFFQSIPYLIFIELILIFFPILFHGIYGTWIVLTGESNVLQYRYYRNWFYWIQRLSGVITLIFVVWHVWNTRLQTIFFGTEISFEFMHNLLSQPVNAVLYAIGLIAATFHFANGMWAFLVSWGITIGPKAQRTSTIIWSLFFIVITIIGLNALFGFING